MKKNNGSITTYQRAQPYYKLEKSEYEHYLEIRADEKYQHVLIGADFLHREMDKLLARLDYVQKEILRLKEGGKPIGQDAKCELKGLRILEKNLLFFKEEFSRISSSGITSHQTVRTINTSKKGKQ